jgi:hypothetical protein
MSVRAFIKKPLLWMYSGGVLLFIIAAVLWCGTVMRQPERVFWGMMEQNLATSAVTIRAAQGDENRSIRQTMQYSFGAQNLSRSLTTISQQGTMVQTETIGTPQADYTRYASIRTDQKGPNGKELDLSKIVGVWAKEEDTKGRLFPEAVLGTGLPIGGMVVPIGKLQPKARAELLNQIHDDAVYQIDFKKVQKKHEGGRLVYTYDVTIQTVGYAALMKAFAGALGLHDLDSLDPSAYAGRPPLKLRISVDSKSHQLTKVALPDQAYEQAYSAYDVPVRATLPGKTITTAQLQQRLTDLQ